MEREENRYLYLVIREHDAAFQSVHLTPKPALAARNRSPEVCSVMIVDTEHACAYLTKPLGEE